MKTYLFTLCTFIALAGLASAEPGQATDAKRQAPPAPATSGASNGGDVDRTVPKTAIEQHGTIKTPQPEAATDKPKMPADKTKDSTGTEPKDKAKASTAKDDKVTTRDHGADKTTTPAPPANADTKDLRTEDKAKSGDKHSDHDKGTQKPKS